MQSQPSCPDQGEPTYTAWQPANRLANRLAFNRQELFLYALLSLLMVLDGSTDQLLISTDSLRHDCLITPTSAWNCSPQLTW